MCQQLAAALVVALTLAAAGCSHYKWGSVPPDVTSNQSGETKQDSHRRSVPTGPVVETVITPPDWGLDGNALANVTVRALHRHGARRATRAPSQKTDARVTCRLRGDHPRAFGPHQLARVLAHCRWHARRGDHSFGATAVGTVSTAADTAGGPSTVPARRRALRTAARQALSRAASRLLADWRRRQPDTSPRPTDN